MHGEKNRGKGRSVEFNMSEFKELISDKLYHGFRSQIATIKKLPLVQFECRIKVKCLFTSGKAIKIVLPFSITCLHEAIFLKILQPKQHITTDCRTDKIYISSFKSDIRDLRQNVKQHHSSH